MIRRATDKGFSALELGMVMLIITIVTGVVIFVGKEARDKLYSLRGMLAEAHMKSGDFKTASAELEKVVAYFKESAKYMEMLAQTYAALRLYTKAIDEYSRLISIDSTIQAIC